MSKLKLEDLERQRGIAADLYWEAKVTKDRELKLKADIELERLFNISIKNGSEGPELSFLTHRFDLQYGGLRGQSEVQRHYWVGNVSVHFERSADCLHWLILKGFIPKSELDGEGCGELPYAWEADGEVDGVPVHFSNYEGDFTIRAAEEYYPNPYK